MSFQGKKRKFPQNLCNICLAFIIQSSPCLPYRQNVLCVGMFSQIPWAEETKKGECLCCVGTQGIWDLILHLGVTPSNPSPSIPDWQQGLFYGHALGKEMDLDFLFSPRQDRKGKMDIFSCEIYARLDISCLQLTMSEGCLLSKTCLWEVWTLPERSSSCEVWRAWLCLSFGDVSGPQETESAQEQALTQRVCSERHR